MYINYTGKFTGPVKPQYTAFKHHNSGSTPNEKPGNKRPLDADLVLFCRCRCEGRKDRITQGLKEAVDRVALHNKNQP